MSTTPTTVQKSTDFGDAFDAALALLESDDDATDNAKKNKSNNNINKSTLMIAKTPRFNNQPSTGKSSFKLSSKVNASAGSEKSEFDSDDESYPESELSDSYRSTSGHFGRGVNMKLNLKELDGLSPRARKMMGMDLQVWVLLLLLLFCVFCVFCEHMRVMNRLRDC
jgi:hypothetical protein